MSTKTKKSAPAPKAKKGQSAATEKARREAIAEIQTRIEAPGVPTDETAPAANVGHDGGPGDDSAVVPANEAKPSARRPKGAKANKGEKTESQKADHTQQQRDAKPKRVSALDAAATVLAAAAVPMRAKDLIAEMLSQGLWTSPAGKTPEATLYAAITREITVKGADSRFAKHDKGLFVATQK